MLTRIPGSQILDGRLVTLTGSSEIELLGLDAILFEPIPTQPEEITEDILSLEMPMLHGFTQQLLGLPCICSNPVAFEILPSFLVELFPGRVLPALIEIPTRRRGVGSSGKKNQAQTSDVVSWKLCRHSEWIQGRSRQQQQDQRKKYNGR
jgi:hypothetical protein